VRWSPPAPRLAWPSSRAAIGLKGSIERIGEMEVAVQAEGQ